MPSPPREYLVKVEAAPRAVPAAATAAANLFADQHRDLPRVWHSIDFASVRWFRDDPFGFSPTQRAIVAVLWNAWEHGTPDVSEAAILEEAGAETKKIAQLFRGHEAFGVMIQRSSLHGGPPGCFRLVPPAEGGGE